MVDVGHALLDIRNSFGAVFLGAMVSLPLTGLTTLQAYYYYNTYTKDSRNMKLLVLAVWLLDIAHSALVIETLWYYFIVQYGNFIALLFGTTSLYTTILLNVFTAVIAQLFFAQRIFILAPRKIRWWLWGTLVVLVTGHAVFGLLTLVGLFQDPRITHITDLNHWVLPFSILTVTADIAIAGSLCILLHSRRTGYHGTNKIVDALVLFAINRCVLTSVTALAETVIFIVWPSSGWFVALDFVIGKLYASSLLATLNSRRALHAASLSSGGPRTRSRSGTGTGTDPSGAHSVPMTRLRFAAMGRGAEGSSSGGPTDTSLSASGSGPSTYGGGAPFLDVAITKSEVARHEAYVFEGEEGAYDEADEAKDSYIVP